MLLQSIAVSLLLFMPVWAHLVTFSFLQRKASEQFELPLEMPRYNLADFMILTALISIATALGSYIGIDPETENWVLIVSLNLLLILMWYKCNRFMQKNAIHENKSRIAMQLFVYPSSILALSFFLISSLWVVIGVIGSLVPSYDDPVIRELPNSLFCMVFAAAWIYLTRRSFSSILGRNPLQATQ
ncbi:MAG: hypothetical protein AAFN77_11935 [Planctomycetota bacterium]